MILRPSLPAAAACFCAMLITVQPLPAHASEKDGTAVHSDSAHPAGRINNRVSNRVQGRLQTRVANRVDPKDPSHSRTNAASQSAHSISRAVQVQP